MLEQHKQIVVKVNVGRVILAESIANMQLIFPTIAAYLPSFRMF